MTKVQSQYCLHEQFASHIISVEDLSWCQSTDYKNSANIHFLFLIYSHYCRRFVPGYCSFTNPQELYFCFSYFSHRKIITNIIAMNVWQIVADKSGRQIVRNEVLLSEQGFRPTIILQNNHNYNHHKCDYSSCHSPTSMLSFKGFPSYR